MQSTQLSPRLVHVATPAIENPPAQASPAIATGVFLRQVALTPPPLPARKPKITPPENLEPFRLPLSVADHVPRPPEVAPPHRVPTQSKPPLLSLPPAADNPAEQAVCSPHPPEGLPPGGRNKTRSRFHNVLHLSSILRKVRNQSIADRKAQNLITDEHAKLFNKIQELPETSPTPGQPIEYAGHFFCSQFFENTSGDGRAKWLLFLNLADSPLQTEEVQYLLWAITHMEGYGQRFEIGDIQLCHEKVKIRKLTSSTTPNKFYLEAKGEEVCVRLHEKVLQKMEIHYRLAKILYLLGNERETDPNRKEVINNSTPQVNFQLFENPERRSLTKWALCVDLTDTQLSKDEVQYLLWHILQTREFGALFTIRHVKTLYSRKELIKVKNRTYEEVNGNIVGNHLNENVFLPVLSISPESPLLNPSMPLPKSPRPFRLFPSTPDDGAEPGAHLQQPKRHHVRFRNLSAPPLLHLPQSAADNAAEQNVRIPHPPKESRYKESSLQNGAPHLAAMKVGSPREIRSPRIKRMQEQLITNQLSSLLDDFQNHPATSEDTKQTFEAGEKPFGYKLSENTSRKKNASLYNLYLTITEPLLQEEVQYLLWKIIHMDGYDELFKIKRIILSHNVVDIEQLTSNSPTGNSFDLKVDGKKIGDSLHDSVTRLILHCWNLSHQMLPYFKNYAHLRTLHFSTPFQDENNPVREEHVKEACPNIKKVIMENPKYIEIPKE